MRDATAAPTGRGLDEDIHAFFAAVLEQFAGDGRWVAATAPAKGGGIDVWFKLHATPADPGFDAIWSRQLGACGLRSQAISGRN